MGDIKAKGIEALIDKESKVLILGSFPGKESRDKNIYYADKSNRIFKVLGVIFKEDVLNDYELRKEFLKRHHIAFYDVIKECETHGAKDKKIKNPVPIDLKRLLEEYPNIKVIGVCGKYAKKKFNNFFKKCEIEREFEAEVVWLPSTSGLNTKYKLEDLVREFRKAVRE